MNTKTRGRIEPWTISLLAIWLTNISLTLTPCPPLLTLPSFIIASQYRDEEERSGGAEGERRRREKEGGTEDMKGAERERGFDEERELKRRGRRKERGRKEG